MSCSIGTFPSSNSGSSSLYFKHLLSGCQNDLAPALGARYNFLMRIISRRTLREFWEGYPDAEQPLRAWHANVKKADWQTPTDVKLDYRNASFVANNRVVFNIKGNHYRLVVAVNYSYSIIYIRFVGTHKEYDQIDAATI